MVRGGPGSSRIECSLLLHLLVFQQQMMHPLPQLTTIIIVLLLQQRIHRR
ncbi:unnamed protein product [Heterosigma akashiwo]